MICGERWGDGDDQACVRGEHYGVHIDARGREWGYVPNEGSPW